MTHTPVPINETERVKALEQYKILDTLSEQEFDRITELASIICNVPVSLVSLVDENRQWFKSVLGLEIQETNRDISFCRYAILGSELLEVPDATKDSRFHHNPLVTGDPNIRFYAGFPLIDPNGYALGTLCVIDRQPRTLTDIQKRALKLLSEEVITLIVERRKRIETVIFEKLFNLSNDLVFIGGDDGFFKTVNPAFTIVLGWDEKYLLNTSTFEFIHPDDIESTATQLKKLSAGEPTVNFLQRFKCKSGEYKTIQWTSTPEPSTGDIFGIGRDVTEKYQLEKALENTKAILETTNRVARVGGWEFDLQTQTVQWTSITKEIHGVPPDYQPQLDTSINFYKPGESRDKITKAVNKAATEGTPWSEELQIINFAGREIWVRALGYVEFKNGAAKRLYGTFQDIDDYKRAELALQDSITSQRKLNDDLKVQMELVKEQDQTIEKILEFRFLADSIPQIIWTANADGSTDYYNKHWFAYTGMTPEQTVENEWKTILHPDDLEQDLNLWSESLAMGKPYRSEVRFKRAADGIYKWHLCTALPMFGEDGAISKWFGSCYDIDEYKRALDLENRISLYEDFNRIVAHNLRGPSGSIGLILNMMEEAEDEAERGELLGMLRQSSDTLNETLNDLMKVLEVRINKNLTNDECDLANTITVTENMLKGQIAEKKALVISDLQVPVLHFPKMYLESIFYNMISNAIKYSRPGIPPRIHITSKMLNGRVSLTFADNGLGIDLERHGDAMFKLNGVFHSGHDSKGVGLFMTKTQIETFGGKISVESEPNVGSTFTIVF